MKKFLLLTISFVLIVLVGAGCSASPGVKEGAAPVLSALIGGEGAGKGAGIILSQQDVGLWVTGEGKAYGTPDVAILRLGVDVQEKSVAGAQREAADAMDKVVKALKGKGVADKDIQTQQFNIQVVKRWLDKENREEIIGYRVTNMVTAKIRKVNDAGSVIDVVAMAGGNVTRIDSISFTVDDPTNYHKEARDKAVASTIAKAKQIAAAAGIKLGKPMYINESMSYIPPVRNYMKADAAAPSAPTPISPGELEFQITVQMVYTME